MEGVTVITPTIPGREDKLARCKASVTAQTQPVVDHLMLLDPPRSDMASPVHCAHMQNELLERVASAWTMRLADDDYLLPEHVASLPETADVVYSYDAGGSRPRVDCTEWRREDLVRRLWSSNFIDGSAVAVRTALLRSVGGWPTKWVGPPTIETGHFAGQVANCEDWALWYLLAKAGARFACVPKQTWVYDDGAHDRISNGH